jgi:4-diphosphocytidyl-2-C-methyl-D-erythritol kinase
MSNAITVKAPAKVNLTLEVVERLPNGYHDIRSVIVRLRRLADVVQVRVRRGAYGIGISTKSRDIPVDETNICHRAASRYLNHAGETAQVHIDIDKSIPVAAGLGGGSSDAGAVLLALNRHFRGRISPGKLIEIASEIGKDLPFFLSGAATGQVSGMGEDVQVIPSLLHANVLIVNPRIAVSTKDAYGALSERLWFMGRKDRANRSKAMTSAIEATDLAGIAAALYNDFEIVVEHMHPIIKEIKQSLLAFGARGALMSGSGPTVFGLFSSTKPLVTAQAALKAHYPLFFIERG